MSNLTSSLTIKLIDDASAPARTVAKALEMAEKEAKAVSKAMAGSNASDKFTAQLSKMGLAAKDVEKVSAAFRDYARASNLAAKSTDWTKTQTANFRQMETRAVSALRSMKREQDAFNKSQNSPAGGSHGGMTGRQMAIGIAGGYVAHSAAHFAHKSLETYREFDKERRFGKAVMGISDADQEPLVRQAIHMGASTKFNDIQVLEAQRELAARGLKKDQILGMMGAAGDLGQALDLSLPDSVKQMEGAIFGFKKNIETTADALASAKQTADIQVAAAKRSGMTPEDISQLYKYGAAPAKLSGVSESTLLTFGGVSKKANIGGDEAGVAFRALIANSQSPTRGAKTALLANGLDFKNYQSKIDSVPLEPFTRAVAAEYGLRLSEKAKASLGKVFSDKTMINDPALFTPAVVDALANSGLSKKEAKSAASLASLANRFRNAAGGGADINRYMLDLMLKLPGNIKLANALFGSKQGARIANAFSDPKFTSALKEFLDKQSSGYAKQISDERMAGFDGAMSRFENSTKNLETALGRAFDAGGKGGMLTGIADGVGRFVQSLSEAPPALQRLGVEAGAAAAIFAGMKGAEALMGGFGLKGSAVALTAAAEALQGAALTQRASSLANDIPGGGGKQVTGRLGKVLKSLPLIGTAAVAVEESSELASQYIDRNKALVAGGTPDRDLANRYSPESELPGLQESEDKAAAAKTALDGLNTTVAPVVDTTSLTESLGIIQSVLAGLREISGVSRGVSGVLQKLTVPSLGATQRGDFRAGGVQGE